MPPACRIAHTQKWTRDAAGICGGEELSCVSQPGRDGHCPVGT